MAQVASLVADEAVAVALPVIDRDHLRSMSFGDCSLERELLQLFDRQIEILVARMRSSDAAAVATLAHTLKGSATGVGAFNVAEAADMAERAAGGSPAELDVALMQLVQAGEETRTLIAEMLRGQH
jgi:HPt (histidine-containing phosphotransfer) domain-containing protein